MTSPKKGQWPYPDGAPKRTNTFFEPTAEPLNLGKSKSYWQAPTPHRAASIPSWAQVRNTYNDGRGPLGVETCLGALTLLGSEMPAAVKKQRQEKAASVATVQDWYLIVFDAFDPHGSGQLQIETFMPVILEINPDIPKWHIKWSFNGAAGATDKDATSLSREQFVKWAEGIFEEHSRAEVKEMVQEMLLTGARLTADQDHAMLLREVAEQQRTVVEEAPDELQSAAPGEVLWMNVHPVHRATFDCSALYDSSVSVFRQRISDEFAKHEVFLAPSEMRLFFESEELLDMEHREIGTNSLNEPIVVTIEKKLQDYIPKSVLAKESDPSKTAAENSQELWLYQKQFVNAFDRFMVGLRQRMSDAFRLFNEVDSDGSGALDKEELRQATTDLGLDIEPAEYDEVWELLDEDGSGELDYTELVKAVNEHVPKSYL